MNRDGFDFRVFDEDSFEKFLLRPENIDRIKETIEQGPCHPPNHNILRSKFARYAYLVRLPRMLAGLVSTILTSWLVIPVDIAIWLAVIAGILFFGLAGGE